MPRERRSGAPDPERRSQDIDRDNDTAALLAVLPIGSENPMPARTVAWRLGISRRAVGEAVHEARLEGHLVGSTCGNNPGYFLATTLGEAEFGLAHVFARAFASLEVARAVHRSARQAFGQQAPTLWDAMGRLL